MGKVTGTITVNVVPDFVTRQRQASTLNDPAVLKSWYSFGPDSIREQIAGNVYAAEDLLEKASRSSSIPIRVRVAENTSTSQSVLRQLSKDGDTKEAFQVTFAVMRNPITSAEILREVAETTKNVYVLELASNHLNMPVETLCSLSRSPEVRIRKAIASNPRTPAHILEQLLTDESFEVPLRVVHNPSLPFETLMAYSNLNTGYMIGWYAFLNKINSMHEAEFREKVDPIMKERKLPAGMPRSWVIKMLEPEWL